MGVDVAVSRVAQILAMQQQLANPAAAASSSAAQSGGSAPSAGSSFSSALASAQSAYGSPGAAAPSSPQALASAANAASYAGALAAAGDPSAASSATGADPAALALAAGGASPYGTASLASAGAAPYGATVPGLTGATGLTGGVGLTGAPSGAGDQQVQAMTQMAQSLIGKPYILGGGHGSWAPQAGYDCSGFVSAVLHAGGYLTSPADTTAMPSQPRILAGPGQRVTIYDRALPGEQGHVIIEIDGQFYESGGETGPWGGGGGVARIGHPTDAYLATFPNVLHPAGL